MALTSCQVQVPLKSSENVLISFWGFLFNPSNESNVATCKLLDESNISVLASLRADLISAMALAASASAICSIGLGLCSLSLCIGSLSFGIWSPSSGFCSIGLDPCCLSLGFWRLCSGFCSYCVFLFASISSIFVPSRSLIWVANISGTDCSLQRNQ